MWFFRFVLIDLIVKQFKLNSLKQFIIQFFTLLEMGQI
jgi:hypothetical protein